MKQFNTVASLKLAKLQAGLFVDTLGYYASGDKGAASYQIKTAAQAATDGDVIDGYVNHTLANGNVAIISEDTLRATQAGADPTGVTDSHLQLIAADLKESNVHIDAGTFLLTQPYVLSNPKDTKGSGNKTEIKAGVGFIGNILEIAPVAGTDPKNWNVGNFKITNSGSATNAVLLDIANTGEYLSKLTVSNIVLNTQVSNNFVELVNTIPNLDGLFTSVFKDNWSFGGYYMDNIGDSCYFIRNTTTGAGYGYYINQLDTAANVTIRDGNCTVSGNALYVAKGFNVTFDNMQVECPLPFTGNDNACVSINPVGGGGLVTNVQITNSSINTQGNPLRCIYLQESDLVKIDSNNLYCDSAGGGSHLFIDALARNTIIGNNKYFDSQTGVEIDPIIVDNGIGTVGIWKDLSFTKSGWVSQGSGSEHPLGVFKAEDGTVHLRGRGAGGATTAGETLFTLPVGFRPKSNAYLIGAYSAGVGDSSVIQILPTGEVQSLTAGTALIYFTNITFSTL